MWPAGRWLGYFTFLSLFQPQELILEPPPDVWPGFRYDAMLVLLGLLSYAIAAAVFWCATFPRLGRRQLSSGGQTTLFKDRLVNWLRFRNLGIRDLLVPNPDPWTVARPHPLAPLSHAGEERFSLFRPLVLLCR